MRAWKNKDWEEIEEIITENTHLSRRDLSKKCGVSRSTKRFVSLCEKHGIKNLLKIRNWKKEAPPPVEPKDDRQILTPLMLAKRPVPPPITGPAKWVFGRNGWERVPLYPPRSQKQPQEPRFTPSP